MKLLHYAFPILAFVVYVNAFGYPQTLKEIPPGFSSVPRVSALEPSKFLDEYLKNGWLNTEDRNSIWTIASLNQKYPELFTESTRILVVDDPTVSAELKRFYRVPGCLRWNNVGPIIDAEFFFPNPVIPVAPNRAHIDGGCLSTYSVQLEGRKMWLLWPPEELGNVSHMASPIATIMNPAPSLSMSINWDHYDSHFGPTDYYATVGKELMYNHPEYCFCAIPWNLGMRATLHAAACFAALEDVTSRIRSFVIMSLVLVCTLFIAAFTRKRPPPHKRED